MADDREPPPLFDDDEEEIDIKDTEDPDKDDEDLFTSIQKEKPDATSKENIDDREDKEDIFADAQDEVPLDSPQDSPREGATQGNATANDDPPKMGVSQSESKTAKSMKAAAPPSAIEEKDYMRDETDDEDVDRFNIEITITEPKKIGDGMGAYMAYKVNTKTTLPQFKHAESSVYRRFSDFLGLHDKLVARHLPLGRIIPPAPEKSVVGMTKIKMSKEDSSSTDFVEKRRSSLERFLNRSARHPEVRIDSDFIDFLEQDGDLPKSSSTSALSGAGVMRLFNKVGDQIGKIAFKMDETDQWFEEKQQQIEALDTQLRKLHSSIEALVAYRKELAANTGAFAKSAAMLGNAEENTALSRALSQLAEIEEKLDQLHQEQADNDFFVFAELIKDYIHLIGAIKEVFHERVKMFKHWKDAEALLTKKREQRAKLELARKLDKIPQLSYEITECEKKVDQGQQDFETISKNIRLEITRFEKQRVRDFKSTLINYLESLMNNQQQVIKYWETFLPEAKAIA